MLFNIACCTVQSISTKKLLVPNVNDDEYEKYYIIGIFQGLELEDRTEKIRQGITIEIFKYHSHAFT